MISRRAFFARASVAASALALDPERLLWTPGAKTFSIPRPSFSPVTLRALDAYMPSEAEIRAMANHIDWLALQVYQGILLSEYGDLREHSPYWRGPGRYGQFLSPSCDGG